jgi:type VI secretion system secreted protein Hcp
MGQRGSTVRLRGSVRSLCPLWQPSKSGKEVQHYAVELLNASIAGVRYEMLNNKYPENLQHGEREHTSFCWQKITWTWMDGGITAEDDWETPVV